MGFRIEAFLGPPGGVLGFGVHRAVAEALDLGLKAEDGGKARVTLTSPECP